MDWAIRILGRIPIAKRFVGLLFQRHLHQRASVELVAHELDYNAAQMDNDRSPTNKHKYVHFDAWQDYRLDIHLRLRGNPDLWRDVTAVYDDVARMEHGADAPEGDRLRKVAERLRATLN